MFRKHPSILRNKGIGKALFEVGWIEQWGTGIGKMRDLCKAAGLPEPVFEEQQGFRVTFRKDIYNEEHMKKLGLNKSQLAAIKHVKERGKITNREYQILNGVSNKTAYMELNLLVNKGLLSAAGSGRSVHYILKVMIE